MRRTRALIREARAAVDFEVALPARLPRGWRLAGVDAIPGSRSTVTLLYATRDGRGFRMHQRLRVVPLLEELAITGREPRRIADAGREVYLVDGAYVGSGEPIDGMHLHMTRQEIFWEIGEVIGELEFRVAVDASTDEMLGIASSVSTRRVRRRRTASRSRDARSTRSAWRRPGHSLR